MRYRNRIGVVEYFKSMFENTIYVADVSEAFEQFEEKYGESDIPVLLAISRVGCTPLPLQQSPFQRSRGYMNPVVPDKISRSNVILEFEVSYDITILATSSYLCDTIVDELYMRIARNPNYTYDSGALDPDNPEENLMLEGSIRLSNDMFGEMSEAPDTESQGRVYRTSFTVTTRSYAFESIETKQVIHIPISTDPDMSK